MELVIQNYEIKRLRDQINEIEETSRILNSIKKEIIAKFEETKQNIRTFTSGQKQGCPEAIRPSILVREKTVSLLDRDISHIQNLHDVVVHDLETLKDSLEHHIAIVEKTELITNILNYKLYESQYTFRSQLDKLQKRKESLTKICATGHEEPNVALQLVEINDEISNLEHNQHKELECVKEQKIDTQKAYERAHQKMDENFEKMSNGFNKLLILIEAEKSTLGASQSKLVDSKFADKVDKFKTDIEKFTELQTTGWKILYPEEKISGCETWYFQSKTKPERISLLPASSATPWSSNGNTSTYQCGSNTASREFSATRVVKNEKSSKSRRRVLRRLVLLKSKKDSTLTDRTDSFAELLHKRGLKILHSGVLITDEGQTITFKQAKASKLLDDINPDMLEELKANLTTNNNGDNNSVSTKSDLSTGSKLLASEDIDYLKERLGKPLSLAIAEITAVQPRDPIHYLGHWLFKYRYNRQMADVNSIEFDILNDKRAKLAQERWHKFIEEEARAVVIDMIIHAEEIAMMNELRRIQQEAEAMEEMENYDDEARDTLGPYNGPPTGQMPL